MKRTSLILILTIVGGVALAQPAFLTAQTPRQDSEAHRLWLEGRDLFDDFKFAEAEKKFREALSKYPKAEQIDRQAYYLILTLEKLNRIGEARAEIEAFLRNYPSSKWREDVNELRTDLGGRNTLAEQEAKIAKERAAAQALGSTDLPMGATVQAAVLRQLILLYPDRGFENARDLLSKNADDPVVIANLGTFYLSRSPQAFPLLMSVYTNPAASPKTRENAFYWVNRKNPDKSQVAQVLMEMLAKNENEPVSEALFRMTFEEHRQVLGKIAESSNPDKFSAMEKIYRRGSITLRSDLVTIVARIQDPKAIDFILDAAENDKDLAVRQVAVDALMSRKDVDANRLEDILKTVPRPTRRGGVPVVVAPIARGRGPSPVSRAPQAPVPPPSTK